MEIIFRKAAPGDIARLTELRLKQLTEEGAAPAADLAPEISAYYSAAMRDGSFVAWVAGADGTIVASCGMCFYQKPPYCQNVHGGLGEVCSVFTEKEYRRRGIAKTLLSKIAGEAAARGVHMLRVSASKTGAKLYHNYGFSKADNFFTLNLSKNFGK